MRQLRRVRLQIEIKLDEFQISKVVGQKDVRSALKEFLSLGRLKRQSLLVQDPLHFALLVRLVWKIN